MNIKAFLKNLSSLLLCAIIIICTFALVIITVLQTTVFSKSYYQQLAESDTYHKLVKSAVESDVLAQSSYVGIPQEILLAGFSDELLIKELNDYMINTAEYLNFNSDQKSPEYSFELFTPALVAFLVDDAKANNYTPSTEQFLLLDEVAKDTSDIIKKHINLFQLNLFTNASSFNIAHTQLYNLSKMGPLVLFIWVLAILLLSFIHSKQLKKWLFYLFTSFWIVGSTILIPSIVLNQFRLVQRLSIDTLYIKYASDLLLTSVINAFQNTGLLIFLLSTMGLIFYATAYSIKRQL